MLILKDEDIAVKVLLVFKRAFSAFYNNNENFVNVIPYATAILLVAGCYGFHELQAQLLAQQFNVALAAQYVEHCMQ